MNPVDVLYMVFFSLMIFSSSLWLLVYFRNLGKVEKDPEPSEYRDISFIVPAYNEEDCVGETIQALLEVEYPEEKKEIIAVNDGSTDSTLEVLEKFGDSITRIDKENTGKAGSMNRALEEVDTEYVACMDADSVPSKDYLKSIVGHLDREDVAGVTPAMKLKSDSGLVEKIQWTEYIYQIFLRKVFALFRVQYVMPGPGSVYKASFLKETGGWDTDTHTEDMEIAFRMVSKGYNVENSTNAVVETSPPSSFAALFRQRIRWYKGYIENFIKYRNLFGNPDSGNMGVFLLPLNTVWILMMVFLLGHTSFSIMNSLFQKANTYLMLGYVPFDISLSLQSFHFFHLFIAFFGLIGVGAMMISLHTAEEPVDLKDKKTNYATFFTIYPYLFAMFWVATFFDYIKDRGRRKIKW